MKQKQLKIGSLFGKHIFSLLILFTYSFILLESFFYTGVLRKYILIDSRFLLVITVIAGIFVRQAKITSKINHIILLTSTALYLIMQRSEILNFPNYVFSNYHIQPGNFLYLVIFSAALAVADGIKLLPLKASPYKFIIYLVVGSVLFNNLAITTHLAATSDMNIILKPFATYDQKMEDYWGFYYQYVNFVKDNTPESSTIMTPPKELPWYSTGNVALVRYFLHPRKIIPGTFEQTDFSKADYVMLTWGEWEGAPESKYGWPKNEVSSEETIYFTDDKKWGIIKIRK